MNHAKPRKDQCESVIVNAQLISDKAEMISSRCLGHWVALRSCVTAPLFAHAASSFSLSQSQQSAPITSIAQARLSDFAIPVLRHHSLEIYHYHELRDNQSNIDPEAMPPTPPGRRRNIARSLEPYEQATVPLPFEPQRNIEGFSRPWDQYIPPTSFE